MKILHLIATARMSASAEILVLLARAQRAAGHEVLVGCHRVGDGPLPARLAEVGVELTPLIVHSASRNPLNHARDAYNLRRVVESFGPEVVHTHLPPDHTVAALTLVRSTAGTVVVRSLADTRSLAWGMVNRTCWHMTDAVAAHSVQHAHMLVRRFGLDPDRVEALPAPIDTERFRPDAAPAATPFGPDAFVVVMPARFVPDRGHEAAVSAVAALKDEMPDLRLLCVGEGDSAAVTAAAAAAGVAERVHCVEIDAADAAYAALLTAGAAALCPEPAGDLTTTKALQAAACGRAVIAPPVGQVVTTLVHGESAWFTPGPAPDAAETAHALRIVRARDHRAMGDAAARAVRAVHDPVDTAHAVLTLYRHALRRPLRAGRKADRTLRELGLV